jgi:beta-ribofuranosylaminobenzene 5'-phosphate synthase
MKADIPIGKIIQHHNIEARREILNARVFNANEDMSRIFSICRNEPLLSRQYKIIHNDKPLIFIEEQFPYNKFLDEQRVIVETPSRIHVTLIDMHGGLGRVDGGVGLTLNEPSILLEVKRSSELEVHGCDPRTEERIKHLTRQVLKNIHIEGNASITVRTIFPSHIGLGSGSQLALATARALCELFGRTMTVPELAQLVGRGGTSGIGTAAFASGGFIIDGGHRFGSKSEKSDFRPSSASRGVKPPPVIVRYDFPSDWRILLAIPNLPTGASGNHEFDIFQQNCPIPVDEVRQLCHEVLMRMLPAIIEHDIDLFGSSINAIQNIGFKKVEHNHQSKQISKLLEAMREAGAAGAGMSSFGPTLYAIGDTDMKSIERTAQSFMQNENGGTTLITSVRNSGASVRVT